MPPEINVASGTSPGRRNFRPDNIQETSRTDQGAGHAGAESSIGFSNPVLLSWRERRANSLYSATITRGHFRS